MAKDTRSQMVEGAIRLLATDGVHGASINRVLEVTGAPKGSVYHHFPGGRDELLEAALTLTAQRHDAWVSEHSGTTPVSVVRAFLDYWRQVLLTSHLRSGCPVLAVTVSAPDGKLFDFAGQVFTDSLGHLRDTLQSVGLAADDARDLATFLVATAEGAVVLARAQHSIEPFELVASRLIEHTGSLPASTR